MNRLCNDSKWIFTVVLLLIQYYKIDLYHSWNTNIVNKNIQFRTSISTSRTTAIHQSTRSNNNDNNNKKIQFRTSSTSSNTAIHQSTRSDHNNNKIKRQSNTQLFSKILKTTRRTIPNSISKLQSHNKQRIEERKSKNREEVDEDGYSDLSCTNFGGMTNETPIWKKLLNIPIRLGHKVTGKRYKIEPGQLILVRHGESTWNQNKTFTGWADPDLSTQGYREIEHAARLLLEGGYKIDIVFTSRLRRAIRSTWVLLQELNEIYLPVFKTWRLNERMYGALQGLSKSETANKLGVGLVQQWRSSLNARPPPVRKSSQYYPGNDRYVHSNDHTTICSNVCFCGCEE